MQSLSKEDETSRACSLINSYPSVRKGWRERASQTTRQFMHRGLRLSRRVFPGCVYLCERSFNRETNPLNGLADEHQMDVEMARTRAIRAIVRTLECRGLLLFAAITCSGCDHIDTSRCVHIVARGFGTKVKIRRPRSRVRLPNRVLESGSQGKFANQSRRPNSQIRFTN
jgi:hypothetical protein